jgi:Uncharacterized protein conserved in cyanobacteria
MPAVVGLDDLAAMNAADAHGRRYETSPEGILFVMPPPDSEHAIIASRLFAWFVRAGWPPEQVLQAIGIRIPGSAVDGGRIPDLTVWRSRPPHGVWLPVADLLLVVEIISPGSSGIDAVTKRDEYAAAGVPRYWVVDRDSASTVTMYTLADGKTYERTAQMPLAWLLNTEPDTHLGPAQ